MNIFRKLIAINMALVMVVFTLPAASFAQVTMLDERVSFSYSESEDHRDFNFRPDSGDGLYIFSLYAVKTGSASSGDLYPDCSTSGGDLYPDCSTSSGDLYPDCSTSGGDLDSYGTASGGNMGGWSTSNGKLVRYNSTVVTSDVFATASDGDLVTDASCGDLKVYCGGVELSGAEFYGSVYDHSDLHNGLKFTLPLTAGKTYTIRHVPASWSSDTVYYLDWVKTTCTMLKSENTTRVCATAGDLNLYTFTAQTTGTYIVSSDTSTSIEVYDSSMKPADNDPGSKEYERYVSVKKSDVYYVQFTSDNNGSHEISISLGSEPVRIDSSEIHGREVSFSVTNDTSETVNFFCSVYDEYGRYAGIRTGTVYARGKKGLICNFGTEFSSASIIVTDSSFAPITSCTIGDSSR